MLTVDIDQTLQQLFAKKGLLFQAASYSFEGGKRLRPRLMFAVMDTFNEPIEKGLQPACALEMIHTYSLIHDDLPCMDNDDLRRGRPTLHRVYPENQALLTGDFLLTYAFELLADAPHLDSETRIALIQTLSKRAGEEGMIGGQLLDLAKPTTLAELLECYSKKTAALFKAALEFGALICQQDVTPFQELGEHLGIAFQIVDDLIDQDGILTFMEAPAARVLVNQLQEKALTILQHLPNGAPLLKELSFSLLNRKL